MSAGSAAANLPSEASGTPSICICDLWVSIAVSAKARSKRSSLKGAQNNLAANNGGDNGDQATVENVDKADGDKEE